MHPVQKNKVLVEIIWWIFTAVVIFIILLPIKENVKDFPFYFQNILLIVAFITFSRHIFFLNLSFIARKKWIKVAIILIAPLFFFIASTALGDFRNFMDEKGLQSLVDHMHVTKQTSMIRYMKHEMIFFGVGSIITGILLPIRMIISLWRMRNKGTV
jgi:hypothetical protein